MPLEALQVLEGVITLVDTFLFDAYDTHRVLHSFPTRRSSDLRSRLWRAGATRCRPVTTSSSRSATSGRARLTRSRAGRSEEHTSELQSHVKLVCRLLLEKKKR